MYTTMCFNHSLLESLLTFFPQIMGAVALAILGSCVTLLVVNRISENQS